MDDCRLITPLAWVTLICHLYLLASLTSEAQPAHYCLHFTQHCPTPRTGSSPRYPRLDALLRGAIGQGAVAGAVGEGTLLVLSGAANGAGGGASWGQAPLVLVTLLEYVCHQDNPEVQVSATAFSDEAKVGLVYFFW